MTDRTRFYRLTIEDHDPSWVEDRLPDVHGAPAADGHWWSDASGAAVNGYEPGAVCGGCGWRPDPPTIDPGDPFANGLSATRYEGVFGRRPAAHPEKG